MTASQNRQRREQGISKVLHDIMDGVGQVYFNPPNRLQYPCILYEIAKRTGKHADDIRYTNRIQYTITVITTDPDSDIPDKVLAALPYTTHENRFVSERLYHDVFTHFE